MGGHLGSNHSLSYFHFQILTHFMIYTRAGSFQMWGRTPRAHGHPQWAGFLRAGVRKERRELGKSCSFPGRRHLAYSQGGSLLSTWVWLPQSFSVLWSEQAQSLRTLPFSPPSIGTQLSSSPGGQSPRLPPQKESSLVRGEWKAEEAAAEGRQGRGQAWKRGAASQWGVSRLHPDLHGIPGISVCGCECLFLEGSGLYQVKMLTEWRELPWSPSLLEFFLLKRKFCPLAMGPGFTATQFLLLLSSPESVCIMSYLPPFLRLFPDGKSRYCRALWGNLMECLWNLYKIPGT